MDPTLYLPLLALIIGATVRALKDDTRLPTVPARWRPWLALGLGALAGVVDAVVAGTPWREAMMNGLGAAVVAILGHVLGVEVLRNGREPFAKSDADTTPTEPRA